MSSTIAKGEEQKVPKSTIPAPTTTITKPSTTTTTTITGNTRKKSTTSVKSSLIIRKNLDKKREQFTRTSSIERLKRFNTFICSQHYLLLLPILLHCLKSTRIIIQTTYESIVIFFKELLLTVYVKLNLFNRLKNKNTFGIFSFYNLRINDIIPTMKFILSIKYNSFNVLYNTLNELLFQLSVYTTIFAIFLQLFTCVYLLTSVPKYLPFGFIFLCTCIYLISQLNFNVLLHMSHKETTILNRIENKSNHNNDNNSNNNNNNRCSRKEDYLNNKGRGNVVIKPKQILCNRTISNVNLF